MMAIVKTQYLETRSNQNARIKSIIPSEKDIIKNVFGNDQEIPQTIYNNIQKIINRGANANALLKIKISDGTSYWTRNRFEPSINNQFKTNFTVKTELSNNNEVDTIKKLYKSLKRIEKNISHQQAEKFLEGYLEEKCISFNELSQIKK